MTIERSVVEARLADVQRDKRALAQSLSELQAMLKRHVSELERATGREAELMGLLALPVAPSTEGEQGHG